MNGCFREKCVTTYLVNFTARPQISRGQFFSRASFYNTVELSDGDRPKCGRLWRWSLMRGSRTWRLDCIYVFNYILRVVICDVIVRQSRMRYCLSSDSLTYIKLYLCYLITSRIQRICKQLWNPAALLCDLACQWRNRREPERETSKVYFQDSTPFAWKLKPTLLYLLSWDSQLNKDTKSTE